jgi:hypothetical protein
MSKNFITSTLQEIQFLHDMDPEYVDRIANISQMREFDQFDVVFCDGELAENLYLVMAGNVHVDAPIGDGHYRHPDTGAWAASGLVVAAWRMLYDSRHDTGVRMVTRD